jgi:hypothetical protein
MAVGPSCVLLLNAETKGASFEAPFVALDVCLRFFSLGYAFLRVNGGLPAGRMACPRKLSNLCEQNP